MVNLNSITIEQISNGLEQASLDLRTKISSDEFINLLSEIKEKYSLLDEIDQNALLEQIMVLFVASLIKPEDLPQAISDFVYLNDQESKEVSDLILNFLKTKQASNPEGNQESKEPLAEPYKPVSIRKEPATETSQTPTPKPFIIHTHEEERARTINTPKTPSWNYKPAFINPKFDARLKPQASQNKIDLTKTKIQQATIENPTKKSERLVNYSTPRVSIHDEAPKEPPLLPAPEKRPTPARIEESNIIDLKDLPK